MIVIQKKEPPAILIEKQRFAEEHSLSAKDAYELLNSSEKKQILASLLEEQGHICAYCMRKIPDEREKPQEIPDCTIEHWFPRRPSDGSEIGQGLDYNNLLAVCSGNRGKKHKKGMLTCDAKREQQYPQLTLNPVKPETLQSLRYTENGILTSSDATIENDINVKLNLNCHAENVQLPEIRKTVLTALQMEIDLVNDEEKFQYCKDVLDMYIHETDPKTPYVGILIWWLRDYISIHENE